MSPYIIQKLALFERSKNWVNQMTSVMFLLFFRYGTWIINTAPLRLRVGYHFGHDCDLPSITCCTFVINPRTVRILEPYAWPKIKIENKNYLSCEALHHIEKLVHFALFYVTFSESQNENKHIYILCVVPFLLSLCIRCGFFLPWLIVMHILCFSLYYCERLYIKNNA